MKQTVLMIFHIFLLTACSANSRIQTSKENELNRISLVQTPEVNLLKARSNLTKFTDLKVKTNYLYEEKVKERPLVTLDIKIEKPGYEGPDSAVFITLDGENIQLSSFKGQYILAENLWAPLVHAQNIQYKLMWNHDPLVLMLNENQKNQLIEFFNKAIKHRDVLFPAVPQGKKKW